MNEEGEPEIAMTPNLSRPYYRLSFVNLAMNLATSLAALCEEPDFLNSNRKIHSEVTSSKSRTIGNFFFNWPCIFTKGFVPSKSKHKRSSFSRSIIAK